VLDDARADDLAMMPALQELLLAQGTSFANCFTTTPTCSPARASILRGQYPHNHGVLDNRGFELFFALDREQSSLATWLQDAGYRTALIGKYLNGYRSDEFPEGASATHVPPGWDEWAGVTKEAYFKLEVNENGRIVSYKEQYATDVLAAKALAFVERMTPTGEPFFLYLAPRAPHGPVEYAPRHATAFTDISAPRPPSFNEDDVHDKPAWVQTLRAFNEEQIAEIDAHYISRQRTLLAVDELVAALVEALRRAGTLENTYILLTSDNGYHGGEHRLADDKGSPYEEAIRVPLVVRGPGVPAGQTVSALTSLVDLAPTFAAWADATVPAFVEGRSLATLLAGDAMPAWRRTLLVERHEDSIRKPGFNALRAEDFIYIESHSGEREYYDLAEDPYQLDNIAARVDGGRLAALSERLAALITCDGQACRAVEDAPLPGGTFLARPKFAPITLPL
jgi:arylsulfatase A-like enzyme